MTLVILLYFILAYMIKSLRKERGSFRNQGILNEKQEERFYLS